jgi:hypothetical protein
MSCCCVTTAGWADTPDPFLGNGSVNTFALLGSRFLIMQQLDCYNGRDMFSTSSVPRCYKQGTSVESSVRESVKKGLELEGEEWPLLEQLPGNV